MYVLTLQQVTPKTSIQYFPVVTFQANGIHNLGHFAPFSWLVLYNMASPPRQTEPLAWCSQTDWALGLVLPDRLWALGLVFPGRLSPWLHSQKLQHSLLLSANDGASQKAVAHCYSPRCTCTAVFMAHATESDWMKNCHLLGECFKTGQLGRFYTDKNFSPVIFSVKILNITWLTGPSMKYRGFSLAAVNLQDGQGTSRLAPSDRQQWLP